MYSFCQYYYKTKGHCSKFIIYYTIVDKLAWQSSYYVVQGHTTACLLFPKVVIATFEAFSLRGEVKQTFMDTLGRCAAN